ncbi:hypothetical protein CR513_03761, partial [Mucuna pruriens]
MIPIGIGKGKQQENYPRDDEVRRMLQDLMDKGLVQINSKRKDVKVAIVQGGKPNNAPRPLVIHYTPTGNTPRPLELRVSAPFPYKNSKAVPCRHNVEVKAKSTDVTNIVGIGGITKSGWIYAPENLRKENLEEVRNEESIEFLKFISQSEYELMKVLNEAHVDKNISLDKFGEIVGNIMVNNYLAFSNEEIPTKGRGHNRALNISIKCLDHLLTRVLIDNDSSLNVMPKATLEKFPYDKTRVRNSSTIVRAFDGSKRAVMGELEIPVQIGPFIFQTPF